MDHIFRKLCLRSGQTVLEAACGWGALSLHMAQHYGVHVNAFNISREQISYARERARRQHLCGQLEFVAHEGRVDTLFVDVHAFQWVVFDQQTRTLHNDASSGTMTCLTLRCRNVAGPSIAPNVSIAQ